MARLASRAPVAAVALLFAAFVAAPSALAQAEDVSDVDWAFTLKEATCQGGCAYTTPELTVPAGSNVVLVYDSTGATAPHNVAVTEGATATPTRTEVINPDSGKVFTTFTMPATGSVKYKCDIHPEMTGEVKVGTFSAGGGEAPAGVQVTTLGVNFLAHWVGVISFAVLFILYGLAFFLFKYNETGFTTDHKDRAAPAGGGGAHAYGEPFLASRNFVTILVVLLLVLVAVALYWLSTRVG